MRLAMDTPMLRRFSTFLLAAPLLLAGPSAPAAAADIRDEAGLFSADAVKKARASLSKIEGDAGIEINVDTIDGLNGRTIDDAIKERGRSRGLKGLYVLIAKKESKIEAMASNAYTKYFPVARRREIEDAFVSEFKQRRFDQGLARGVDAIDSVVVRAKSEAGGSFNRTTSPAPAPVPAARRPIPAPVPAPGQRGGGFGLGSVIGIVLVIFAGIMILRLIGSIFGGGRSYGPGPGGMGMGPGGPGYGGPGYGPGYGGGGGGGFFSSLFGGIGGAMAGNWLYDQFSGRNRHGHYDQGVYNNPASTGLPPDQPQGPDWTAEGDGGTSWGSGGGGGSDWGSGGGGGGSDWGGGGGGGSDWGGGGGGDWGGGGGGSDWSGGGGGDWGGGGGSDGGGGSW